MTTDLSDHPTPSLILDRARMEANMADMQRRMDASGISLRPHLKTAKSIEVARLALDLGARGITVSTLKEARYFFDNGVRDILYAVGIVAGKLSEAARLIERGCELKVVTDNIETARAIAAESTAIPCLIEVDTGGARAGVQPEGPELLEIGHVLGARLAGVMTHAGHSYGTSDIAEIKVIAEAERAGAALAADRLRAEGLDCVIVSAGSSPTAIHGERRDGLTEFRAGVYVFHDLFQAAIHTCARDDLALSVLASVIGHNKTAGTILLDAGGLALSKDKGAVGHRPEVGYGEVCDPATLAHHPGLFVADVHQEHGIVPIREEADYTRLPIGAKVRVLPNHACMTAAAYEDYTVLAPDGTQTRWGRINGW